MKFNNFEDMLTRPFIVYADFGVSLVKVYRTDGKTHKHVPNSAGFFMLYAPMMNIETNTTNLQGQTAWSS
jgi:hypothetical protein